MERVRERGNFMILHLMKQNIVPDDENGHVDDRVREPWAPDRVVFPIQICPNGAADADAEGQEICPGVGVTEKIAQQDDVMKREPDA